MDFDLANKRVWVAGHTGMVGGALLRRLAGEQCQVITADRSTLDLRNQSAVQAWVKQNRPDLVIVAAAKVGGIYANDHYPAEFLYDNLIIEANIIEAARLADTQKLVFLGSSCIYPKHASQPITEDALLTGPLELTNEWYALAKIAGVKMCQAYRRQYGLNFISAMPTNLYGPGDNYHIENSHVVPALIRKAHEAKVSAQPEMVIWGTGTPMREFLHVDDLADAIIHLAVHYSGEVHVNVGSSSEISISDLARLIASVVRFDGDVRLDASKPDGTPRKLLDCSKLTALGWRPKIVLADGLRQTYTDFLNNDVRSK